MDDKYLLQYIDTFLEPGKINNLLFTNKYYYSLFNFLGYLNLNYNNSICYIYRLREYYNKKINNKQKQIILNLQHKCYDVNERPDCHIFDRLAMSNMLSSYSTNIYINGCNKYLHTISHRDTIYEPLQIYKFDNLKYILKKHKTYHFMIDANFRKHPNNKLKLYIEKDKSRELKSIYKCFTGIVRFTPQTIICKNFISSNKGHFVLFNVGSLFFIKKMNF